MITAEDARDVGIAQVAANNKQWMLHGQVLLIARFPLGTYGIFERFRLHLMKRHGFYEPTHPNAWGSLSRAAILHRILERTGEREQMITVKSHARESDVLKRVDGWKTLPKFRKVIEGLLPHFQSTSAPFVDIKSKPPQITSFGEE